jgi:prolyl-tRNA editing enzyme YbaK/EbsC (Cys-tRNA(Pro) deacylase)
MEDEGIQGEIVFLAVETPTVEAAAAAAGVRQNQIGKSILFFAQGNPILIIANGSTRVSYKKLARYLGINRKKLKLAKADQVEETSGFPVGTVPPFGHRRPIETLVEQGVLAEKEIYAGGGAINALLRLATAELVYVTGATVIDLRS